MLVEEDAHYLGHVLRMRPGQAIETFDGEGSVNRWKITEITRRKVRLKHAERYQVERRAPVELTLALNPLKNGNEEIAIRMATAMEVYAIQPIIFMRSQVPFDEDILKKRTDRWRRLCLNEAALSGAAYLPRIYKPVDIPNVKDHDYPTCVIFDEEAETARHSIGFQKGTKVVAVVGPEGGIDREEIAVAEVELFDIASFGPWTLRAELAGALVPSWVYSRVT